MKKSDLYALGCFRATALSPEVSVGDPMTNATRIVEMVRSNPGSDLYVFPELSVTGYTCGDLFNQSILLDASDSALEAIAQTTSGIDGLIIVGAPLRAGGKLYNCAVMICRGQIKGAVAKRHLPNYNEFYEKRWFSPAPAASSVAADTLDISIIRNLLVKYSGATIGIEICEDLWTPVPPSGELAMAGANVIVNLSASNEVLGKHRYLRNLISQQSARCRAAYVYAGAGIGESSTDLVFSGNAIIAEDGVILRESARFAYKPLAVTADIDVRRLENDRRKYNSFGEAGCAECDLLSVLHFDTEYLQSAPYDIELGDLQRDVNPYPFVPSSASHRDENCTEIIEIQCHGLARRLLAIGCPKIVVGISGGLDSTLALLVACRTVDHLDNMTRKDIVGITMPGLATSDRTHDNARQLMEELGVTALEIPIGKAVAQHFSDIGQNPETHDAAYENSQARERTQILMDYANKCGGIVLGTGDLSELALGWATYNGDHMSMYGVNASVPKTLVKYLVSWFAERTQNAAERETLKAIIDTPISPELIPAKPGEDGEAIAQKTEELVGPYELHDFFLYYVLRHGFSPRKIYMLANNAFAGKYSSSTILRWMENFYRRFFSQQFKRSCMPDGPKVGSVCLSPRGDWRMPSDASSRLWLGEVEELRKEVNEDE